MDMFAFTLLVLGLVALAIWSKHLREAKQMQIRNIIHKERITAMEKGISIEDLNHDGMARELAQMNEEARTQESGTKKKMMWIRVSSLCFGLIFLFGGIAVAAGFPLVEDVEVQGMWPLGLIPALIGLGLLLFNGLCRGYEKKLN
jgi:hypothetical protein